MLKLTGFICIFILFSSCQGPALEKLQLVKSGKPSGLELRDMSTGPDGCLLANGEGYLKADQAVFGDEIMVAMNLSLNESEGAINVRVGDNDLMIVNKDDNLSAILRGPSIGRTVYLEQLAEHIKPDKKFTLNISYRNKKLSYTIDEEEIYSQLVDIAPAGMIMLTNENIRLNIYDLQAQGQFKSVDKFYTREFLLQRAQKSVALAAERVKGDPNRPGYHFLPPANWNNDPNGMLFYNGYYHMFYQHNPYGDRWDWMHWGHARSKDLVHWEHLPIALWPSVAKGEDHCFSGSGYIKDDGKPILFYTSIGHENPEHWAAVPEDNQLIKWQKHPADPIIVMDDHGGQFIDDWRDPFLFRESGDTYMVIGGHPRGGNGSIMMYKALNSELTNWEFLGVPFSGEEKNWECPNFFKIGQKYVLIYSPHGRVEYYTGSMDFEALKFTPDFHGTVDNGWNYYAPNTLQKKGGRRILFGWIPDFKENQGWQSAISLPRDLSIDSKGRLIQKPVPELADLRGSVDSRSNLILQDRPLKLDVKNLQFEMDLKVDGQGSNHLGIGFNDENGKKMVINLRPEMLSFENEKTNIEHEFAEKIKKVQMFFDRTVIELFVNDGLLCATKVFYPDKQNPDFEIFSNDKGVILKSLDIWQMKSIW